MILASEPSDQGGGSGPEEDATNARDHEGVPHPPVDAPHASLSGSLSKHNQRIVAAKLDEIRRSLHHWSTNPQTCGRFSQSFFPVKPRLKRHKNAVLTACPHADATGARSSLPGHFRVFFNSATGREEAEEAKRFFLLNRYFSEISVFGPAVTCHLLRPLGGKGSTGWINVRMPLWWGRKVRA